MELKVDDYQLPEVIRFNYEELKAEITAKMHDYESLVYTEDCLKEAKTDRAKLNSLKTALNDERLRREREYMESFRPFKDRINELISIIDKSAKAIDKQVKDFEEKQKEEKRVAIGSLFLNQNFPEWVRLPQIFDEKWLNKSVSMKAIDAALHQRKEQIEADLATIKGLTEFSFEAETEYKRSLDLGKAIAEGKRLADIQIAKEAEKAHREAEEARNAMKGAQTQDTKSVDCETVVETEIPKMRVSFWAEVTVMQAKALKEFFNANGIQYGPIQEEGE